MPMSTQEKLQLAANSLGIAFFLLVFITMAIWGNSEKIKMVGVFGAVALFAFVTYKALAR